jgi:hypothetical protein
MQYSFKMVASICAEVEYWKTGILERWNTGILEEFPTRRDERLLVQDTQTRAPPEAGISYSPTIPTFPYSNIPIKVIHKESR